MNPGRLRNLVTLQAATRTDLEGGGWEEGPPVDVATIWAAIEPLEGSERLRAMQVSASLSHRIRIRYRDDVTAKNRIVYGARIFNITAVIDPNERHEELHLLAEEER